MKTFPNEILSKNKNNSLSLAKGPYVRWKRDDEY